jgi:hypothetical protein
MTWYASMDPLATVALLKAFKDQFRYSPSVRSTAVVTCPRTGGRRWMVELPNDSMVAKAIVASEP